MKLKLADIRNGDEVEACVFESGLGSGVVLNSENDVSVLFGSRHKSVKIFHIYACLVKNFKSLCLAYDKILNI